MVIKWSNKVKTSRNARDLKEGVFTLNDPKKIARSLKRSADGFQSAMSMLNFYINRAGKNLSPQRRKKLDAAKVELRDLFGKKA